MASALDTLSGHVDTWVKRLLRSWNPHFPDKGKLVRDAVHGFLVLKPYEIAILDSPLIQRLRYVHQTAFTYLVYPTATHTRFDHTLGVMYVAEKMGQALAMVEDYKEIVTPSVIRELRLAALLHDVGHTFFSHLGEAIVEEYFYDEIVEMKEAQVQGEEGFFEPASLGEILSYLIVTSPQFKRFLDQVMDHYCVDFDVDRVAGLIVGKVRRGSDQFMADIINGPLDADKLDYLLRDCHFSGIKAEVDAERLYYTVMLTTQAGRRYLMASAGALPHAEQLLFAKMMLYTSIYHHHKVRALECMLKAVFEVIKTHPGKIRSRRLRFSRIIDFLTIEEHELFSTAMREAALKKHIEPILRRQLLKRALVLSNSTVTKASRKALLRIKEEATKGPANILTIRQAIHDALPVKHQTSVQNLWLDVPSGPDIHEAARHCFIHLGLKKPQTLARLFPSANWLRSYEANKLRIHVFYVDDEDARREAASAAEKVLNDRFGPLRCLPLARTEANLSAS